MTNPATLIDGYKLDHRRQYPNKTTGVYSNWTPRGSRIEGVKDVVFFGLQYFLKKYLMDEWRAGFFSKPKEEVLAKYKRRVDGYLGPNDIGTAHIAALHDLGYIPLEFRAVAEGSSVALRNPMLTVENTLPEFFWLPNYFETLMSCVLWMPCTSATKAREIRKVLDRAAFATGAAKEFVQWQGHDFSFRGLPGLEAAQLSGAGHLIYFTGTDTVPALDLIEDYYGALPENYLLGASVAATEHSVMCAGGQEGEGETFDRLLALYPSGILSVVSDTWDLWKVLTEILPSRKDVIMARAGKLVIRPDSGNPADIICGDPNAEPGSPASKGVVQLLWETFGGTELPRESRTYKQLDTHIGVIYGDSITRERAEEITDRLRGKGFASSNVVYGVGSYTYQYNTRDTFGFAMKATSVVIDGEERAIFKKPVTDDGVKNSARGRLAIIDGKLVEGATRDQEAQSELGLVWRNGRFVRTESFDIIRNRALGA